MKDLPFEQVWVQIGEFGWYQKRAYLITQYVLFVTGSVTMCVIFLLDIPEHRCAIPGLDNDTYAIQDNHHAELINSSVPSGSKCSVYDHNGSEVACKSWVYDEEYFRPSAAMEFNIVCDSTVYRSVINMVYMTGLLVGGLLGGILGDRFGRKVLMYVSCILQLVASIALIFVQHWYSIMIQRFLVGTLIMCFSGPYYVWSLELVGPSRRQHAAMLSGITSSVGMALMTLHAYLFRNWRYMSVSIAIPQLLCLALWWLIPESPRWLLAANRRKEAEAILRKAATVNKREFPEGILDRVKLEHSIQHENFVKLLKRTVLLKRFLILCVNWVAIATGYYGITLHSGNLSGDIFINFLVNAVVEIPAILFALFAPMKFGRKAPHTFCMILAGTACVLSVFPVLFGNESSAWATTTLSTVGKFGLSAAFASIYAYTVELNPTSLRSTSIGACAIGSRISSMAAPYISDLSELITASYAGILPLVVFGSLCIVAGILSVFLPETYEKPMPETIEDAVIFGRKQKRKRTNSTEHEQAMPVDTRL